MGLGGDASSINKFFPLYFEYPKDFLFMRFACLCLCKTCASEYLPS